ncbi:G protein-coupled glucose receptor regulating Gpa2 [Rhizoctonia solani]|uniref:G protein-coupled glucose receptor regulating Gpa2 n=1 Tax=Rhizoctonia solani TaxID=456999 RepID=A0A8H7M2Z9_9AGAM|nr:G protein-coupled glucose receptor regulating Gpa2 [Rhizoctonia solani]
MAIDEMWYLPYEGHGITATIVASFISFTSVISLFSLLAWVAITGRGPTERPFLKTHIGVYFLSLMTADLSQAIGGIMNIRWVAARHVSIGRFCTAQAAIKQFANVGAALWSIIIAIHTFRLLFFNAHTSNFMCFATLVVIWGGIITVVAAGPTVIQTPSKGDYFGITDLQKMFISAGVSLIGYKIKALSVSSSRAWNLEAGRAVMESNTMSVAWQLMWYPVSYTFTILPITVSRWVEFSGTTVPFEAKMFSKSPPPNQIASQIYVGTSSAHPGISIKISVHATRTQQISSANGDPSYIIALPSPNFSHTENQAYELDDCSRLPVVPEKAESRMSGESTGISVGTGKNDYDIEDGLDQHTIPRPL